MADLQDNQTPDLSSMANPAAAPSAPAPQAPNDNTAVPADPAPEAAAPAQSPSAPAAKKLPSWDEAVSGKLPSWDEAVADNKEPSWQTAFINKFNPFHANKFTEEGRQEMTKAQRDWSQKSAFWNTVTAFGHGYADDFKQSAPLDKDTTDWLKKAGAYDNYINTQNQTNNAIMDAYVVPYAKNIYTAYKEAVATLAESALQTGKAAVTAVTSAPLAGLDAAIDQIGEETQSTELRNDLGAIVESSMIPFAAGPGMFPLEGSHLPSLPPELAAAKANGAMEEEAVYMGTKEPTPDQANSMQAAANMYPEMHAGTWETGPEETLRDVKAEVAPAAAEVPGEASPAPLPEVPKTIHDIAREVDPATFSHYDSEIKKQNTLRNWYADYRDRRNADIEATAPHAEEIKALQNKIDTEEVNARSANRRQAALDKMVQERADYIAEAKKTETPEMAKVREALQQTDYGLRDMATKVGAAYREAEKRLPAPEEAAPKLDPKELRNVRSREETEYTMSSASTMEPDPYHTFSTMAKSLPDEINKKFQVHGLMSGKQDENLLDLLDNGIDNSRGFNSGPPKGGQSGVDSSRTAAPYIIISDAGKSIPETGVKNVVAVGPAEKNIPKLKEKYPGINFMTVDESKDFMNGHTKPAAVTANPAEVSAIPTPEAAVNNTLAPATPKTPDQARISIIGKVQADLAAAGRPAEEASAAAELVASHYQARADRFGGKLGTAEDLYDKDAATVKVGRGEGKTAKGKLRQATEDAKATLTLFKSADASTFFHEKGHEWLDELMKDAAHPEASADIIKDAETVKKYLGVGDDGAIKTAQHEKFARSFERFLMEGTAPNKALAAVFAKLKTWFDGLYKTVDALKAPISDDIRDVFHRFLDANYERTVVAPDVEAAASPATPAPEGLTPEAVNTAGVPTALPEAAAPEAVQSKEANEQAKQMSASNSEAATQEKETPPSAATPLGPADSDLIDKAGNIRLENLNAPEDINKILRDTADENGGFMAARGVVSDSQVMDLADAMGIPASEINLKKLAAEYGQGGLASKIVAGRKLTIQSAIAVRDAMSKAAEGGEAEIVAYAEAKARHLMIMESLSSVTAEAGRALRAFQEISGMEGSEGAQSLGEFLKKQTGKDLFQLQEEARLGQTLETPQAVSKFINDSAKPSFVDMALEIWINALLSGPKTHIKNMLGNMSVALYSIPETALASGVGAARNLLGDKEAGVTAGEAKARLFGLMQGSKDGVVAAAKAFKTEASAIGDTTIEQRKMQAIPGKLGQAVRLPGRFLTAEDELFKSIAMRQELNAVAYRTAANEGLKGDAFNARLADIVLNPSEEVMKQTKEAAEYQTFTNTLGDTGRALQSLANSHPLMKLIIPFIRTPTNILKYAGERTPLGLFSAEVRDNLAGKNGKVMQDTQIARISLGTSVGVASFALADQGLLTGNGPSDPAKKAMLRMTGWAPYSVKIGNTYYSYQWLDPMSSVIGMSADAADLAKSGNDADMDFPKIASMIFAATSKNILSKLSLRGASDLIQAATDPDRYGDKYIQNVLSSVVPSIVSQAASAEDPVLRQARTTIDSLKARIPGLREDLLPKRDVWGEPIISGGSLGPDFVSPVYLSKMNNDPVNQALVRLRISPSAPDRKITGVELSDQQYDDYSKIGGRLMKMRLNAVVASPGFSSLPEQYQVKSITKIVDQSMEQARSIIKMKYPQIPHDAYLNKVAGLKPVAK